MGPRGRPRAGGQRQRRDGKMWARAFAEVSRGRRQGGLGEGQGAAPGCLLPGSGVIGAGAWSPHSRWLGAGGLDALVRMRQPVKGESCLLELVKPRKGSPFRVHQAPRRQSIGTQRSKGLIMQAGR